MNHDTQVLNLSAPTCWEEMDDAQLRYVLRLMAAEIPQVRIQTYCLLRWNRLKPSTPAYPLPEGVALLRGKRDTFRVRTEALSAAVAGLDWMQQSPAVPMRPGMISGRKAVNAELHGVPFSEYIRSENLFQSFLMEETPDALLALFDVLYPGTEPLRDKEKPYACTAILFWMGGLKSLFSTTFSNLFKPAPSGTEQPDMAAVMNAEIRALTGGDITKTQQVLDADTWNALHELNAKAREAEELEKIRNK